MLASIPVWITARKAAAWSGGSKNRHSHYLFIVGCGILAVQAVMAPA
jgi:hypothetical protein